jgi:mannose-6-phosphate isomerase-like protein (cupin superfamily)
VQFLIDRGARLDTKTALGWTALDVANGVFFANAKKEYPAAAAIIRNAMAAQSASPAAGAPAPRPAPANTQSGQPGAATYVDSDKVAEAFAKGGRLSSGPDYAASVARRTGAGQVEVHVKETDIFYIVAGEATFVTGGTMIGGKESRPDQLLGSSIDGGESHHLKKGDYIAIPAGMPHWFKEVPQGITYYMVKVIKP